MLSFHTQNYNHHYRYERRVRYYHQTLNSGLVLVENHRRSVHENTTSITR